MGKKKKKNAKSVNTKGMARQQKILERIEEERDIYEVYAYYTHNHYVLLTS